MKGVDNHLDDLAIRKDRTNGTPALKGPTTPFTWKWPQPPLSSSGILKLSLAVIILIAVILATWFAIGNRAAVATLSTGQCDDPQRAANIVAYINSITLSGRTIAGPLHSVNTSIPQASSMPSLDVAFGSTQQHASTTTPELAVQWLIDQDPLQLRPNSAVNRFRLRQRYALLSLFLMNEAYSSTAPLTTERDECQWGGHVDGNSNVPRVQCSLFGGGTLGRHEVTAIAAYRASGVLSPELGLLTSLTHLSFHGYRDDVVSGSIPSSLGLLTNLVVLAAPSNNLTGSIPESLAGLTRLEEFRFGANRLSGTLPESFGRLSHLEQFQVQQNALTGTLPESIGHWSNAQVIQFGHNAFVGTMPASLGHWTNLVYFGVEDNQMTGTLPEYIGVEWSQHGQLQYATFHHNNFVGNIVINQTCDSAELPVLSADCLSPSNVTCRCCTSCY